MKAIFPALLITLPCWMGVAKAQQKTVGEKAFVLSRFLDKHHYKPVSWNDSSSVLLFHKWMEELDEEKMFFTRKDIRDFEPYQLKLDEAIAAKDMAFFTLSTQRYRRRLQQTDSILKILFAKPFDFTKPDQMVWPAVDYANDEAGIAARWQQYLKRVVMNGIADVMAERKEVPGPQLPKDFAKLEAEQREKIKKRELGYIQDKLQTPTVFLEAMEDLFLNSIAWCYDPHSAYMNMKERKEFETVMTASEYSAGFDVKKDEKGDISIGYLQPGGSAWRSGQLHTGDVLLKVKTGGKETDVADLEEEELEQLLGGMSEESVELTIRTSAGEIRKVVLIKEKITDEESVVKSYLVGKDQKMGYINLPGFYSKDTDGDDIYLQGCANDVSKEIIKLKKDNIAGLILDLRYNGGGSMWEAMQLAGIFIDIGPVASVKGRDGKLQFLKDPNRGTIYDGPLMVLINGGSASASEFVSAVLQDYNRALIVGSSTYGKGTAQVLLPMDTSSNISSLVDGMDKYQDFVKVTGQKFYRVNGSTVQWKSVQPDISIPDLFDDEYYKERSKPTALQPDNSKPGTFQPSPVIPIGALKAKSEARVGKNAHFEHVATLAKYIAASRQSTTFSLQWQAFAERYKKRTELFARMQEDEQKEGTLTVMNNSFDKRRVDESTEQTKSVNETYLKTMRRDEMLEEAYYIMLDWVATKP